MINTGDVYIEGIWPPGVGMNYNHILPANLETMNSKPHDQYTNVIYVTRPFPRTLHQKIADWM